MFKRHRAAAVALLVLGIAVVAIAAGIALSRTGSEPMGASSGTVRQFSASVVSGAEQGDYFQRHPEVMHPGYAVDLSDYFQRHPDWTVAVHGASDWFERHPEASSPAIRED
ncbi:MAG: hypothetical protein ACM3JD_17540 [Rudaea sp.]